MSHASFNGAFARYLAAIGSARDADAHHDQRRHLFVQFLRDGFAIDAEELVLERNIRAASVRGRIDLLYKQVIFEFKRDLERERGQGEAELEKYLTAQLPNTSLGLLTDGTAFDCYVLEGGKLHQFDHRDIADYEDNPEAALLWLDSFLFQGTQIRPTSMDVVRRFGRRSAVFVAATNRLHAMYVDAAGMPEVALKFHEWQRLLAKVYGSDVGDSDLFLRHTFLALFSRVLAFAACAGRTPRPGELGDIIAGRAFREFAENLVEDDFFCWVTHPAVADQARSLLDAVVAHLCVYDLSSIGHEDLLQQLYQELVDPEQRHDLGEYYTPDWLAETALREAGLGVSDTVLDPACGSGTFLFTAIRLLAEQGLSPDELVAHALANVVGIDVHPLAVTIARINYLLALRQYGNLPSFKRSIEIPVFMADALLTADEKSSTYKAIPGPNGADAGAHIPVPTGDGDEFIIPLDMALDAPGLDAVVREMCRYAAETGMADDQLVGGFTQWLHRRGLQAQIPWWARNLRLLLRLVQSGRDTIWGFLLRNAYRPAYLQSRGFSLVVGNPPWLAYRYIKDRGYQKATRSLATRYGIMDRHDAKLYTHAELATLFFAHAREKYLVQGGRICFVMPRSVITGAKQHARFRDAYPYHRLLDLKDVHVPTEPSLKVFGTDSCVYLWRDAPVAGPGLRVSLQGELPAKNVPYAEADARLSRSAESAAEATTTSTASPYLTSARQGATLVPRGLWIVVPASTHHVDHERPLLMTDPSGARAAKPPWTGIEITGSVEADFVYGALLSTCTVPFALTRLALAVLPVLHDAERHAAILLDRRTALASGYAGLAEWLSKAEAIWEARRKQGGSMSACDRLDYHHLLRGQFPLSRNRVVYGASGSHVSAVSLAHVSVGSLADELCAGRWVVDSSLYLVECAGKDECAYLAAVLNSPLVDHAIKRHQPRGAYRGPRHVHRRPFEHVPIPLYDPGDARHAKLAELSARCHEMMGVCELPAKELGRRRQWVRAQLKGELREIDGLVSEVTGVLPVEEP